MALGLRGRCVGGGVRPTINAGQGRGTTQCAFSAQLRQKFAWWMHLGAVAEAERWEYSKSVGSEPPHLPNEGLRPATTTAVAERMDRVRCRRAAAMYLTGCFPAGFPHSRLATWPSHPVAQDARR